MQIPIECLVVAGGGSGGSYVGGGGGGGGVLVGSPTVSLQTYTIIVGGGGAGAGSISAQQSVVGNDGQTSSAFDLVALGGGGGGVYSQVAGRPGGSGGGGGGFQAGTGAGGLGTTGQGFNGGSAIGGRPRSFTGGGGGGGAGATGGESSNAINTGGDGGAGVPSSIRGTQHYYGGGGGGGNYADGARPGNGGIGGGGGGSSNTAGVGGVGGGSTWTGLAGGNGSPTGDPNNNGGGGAVNTGGGGGGVGHYGLSGPGGSGVVIVRYPSALITASGGTITTDGSYTVHTFTSSGDFTVLSISPGLIAPGTVIRGNSFDVTLITENVADNTSIAYTITGATSADLDGDPLSGNFTVVNNTATITIQTATVPLNRTLTISASGYTATVDILVAASVSARCLIVAGGGSGGNSNTTNGNGGGGAGGVLYSDSIEFIGDTTIIVGAGGAAVPNSTIGVGNKGTNSSVPNATAPEFTVTYETMTYVATSNVTLTNNGTQDVTMFKTADNNSWNGEVRSTVAFTAPCTIEFSKQAAATDNAASYAMIGWNQDPTANTSYTSLDYCAYPYTSNTYSVYHNGTQVHFSGVWDVNQRFYVVYDTDGFIRHYNGSTLLYSVSYGQNIPVYVDSSFYSVNSTFGGFSNVKVTRSSWNGTTYTAPDSSYIAQGGGGGGTTASAPTGAMHGGSGGGAANSQAFSSVSTQISIGNAIGYGNPGGSSGVSWTGAGGGGAGSAGVNGAGSAPGGNGGAGRSFDISGTTTFYAGGGGGGGNSSERAGDGFHGGGRGAGTTSYYAYNSYPLGINSTTLGSSTPNAIANTGGGGGGGSYWSANGGWTTGSGNGGSGVVVIRYPGAAKGTGGIITTVGSDTVHTFTASGTFSLTPGQTIYDPGLNIGVSSVYNGDSIEIVYVDQTQADNATVAYTITGVTSLDIDDAALTGNFTMSAGIAYLTLTATNVVNKTLTITAGGSSENVSLQYAVFANYLLVAGGGGGGTDMGGGGGAGGYIAAQQVSMNTGSYSVVVGGGGNGAPQTATNANASGSNGTNTTFNALVAIGGGGGASNHANNISNAGNGGSGGGGSGGRMTNATYGGLPGNGTPGQGNNGAGSGVTWYPGGGGGAGAAASQTGSQQADGGIGIENDILGTAYYWAGGGAGAGYTTYGGNGGRGGGGGGAPRQSDAVTTNGQGDSSGLNPGSNAVIGTLNAQTNVAGGAAGANTGGGGGGGSHYVGANPGGNGGSGIFVIRYPGGQKAVGGTITTVGSDTVHTFTTSGTLTIFPGEGLVPSTPSAFFGDTFTIYLTANEPDNTTVPYTITGVTSAEINDASLTGNFTLVNGIASLEIVTVAGTLDNKTFSISAYGYTATVTLTYLISMTAPSIAGWGADIVITIVTENLAPGATVPYTISGVTTADLLGASLTGNITIAAGTDPKTSTLTIETDPTLLTTKTLTVSIPGGFSTSTSVTFISVPRNITLITAAAGTPAVISTTLSDLKESQSVANQWDYSQVIPTFLVPGGGPLKISPTDPGDLAEQVSVATSPQGHGSEQVLEQVNMVGTRSSPTYVYSDGAPVAAPAPGEQLIQIWYIT